jgi:hypothetical protein
MGVVINRTAVVEQRLETVPLWLDYWNHRAVISEQTEIHVNMLMLHGCTHDVLISFGPTAMVTKQFNPGYLRPTWEPWPTIQTS